MADTFDDIRRDTELSLRMLDEAARHTFGAWRDAVARDFQREFVEPLREAAVDYERALRDAMNAIEELERLE